MKATNLSVSIPNVGCDKNCPYCVSKMTGYVDGNIFNMIRNIEKVRTFAEMADVTSVSFTGKGEPVLNFGNLEKMLTNFNHLPCELQTNGIELSKELGLIDHLYLKGLDIIAVSVDSYFELDKIVAPIVKRAHNFNMTVRVTLNITEKLEHGFESIFRKIKEIGVDQFSIRKISVANFTDNEKVAGWIEKNAPDSL